MLAAPCSDGLDIRVFAKPYPSLLLFIIPLCQFETRCTGNNQRKNNLHSLLEILTDVRCLVKVEKDRRVFV